MQIGFVGLGKMGGIVVNRIRRDSDHEVVAFDFSEDAVKTAVLDVLAPKAHTPDGEEVFGWGHMGGPGAGHFVKMVHNGIEYGLMKWTATTLSRWRAGWTTPERDAGRSTPGSRPTRRCRRWRLRCLPASAPVEPATIPRAPWRLCVTNSGATP
jgi:6-phosphogluconate dehydrogenase (decarboxylating)